MADDDKLKPLELAEGPKVEAPKPGARLDHVMYEAIEKKGGAFFGETHSDPALRQMLVMMIPAAKARGVTTLSVEISQDRIDSMRKAKSTQEWLKSKDNTIRAECDAESLCDLVRAYDKAGIKVIGHEVKDVNFYEHFMRTVEEKRPGAIEKANKELKEIKARHADVKDPVERGGKELADTMVMLEKEFKASDPELQVKLNKILDEEFPGSPKRLQKRNEMAAVYIKENKAPGAMLVIGGSEHADKQTGDKGLDKLLGIPAIKVGVQDVKGKPVGTTVVSQDGKKFEAVLPTDLKKMLEAQKITSWPGDAPPPLKAPFVPGKLGGALDIPSK